MHWYYRTLLMLLPSVLLLVFAYRIPFALPIYVLVVVCIGGSLYSNLS